MSKEKNETVEIAIIGGTGVYDPKLLEDIKQIKIHTPYGSPSDLITVGTYAGTRIAFLSRHHGSHMIPPHKVPYRANIWALHNLGVKRIIAPRAVGSLNENIKPRDIIITDQFIDFTKKRDCTFYEGGEVAHISAAEIFCKELRELAIHAAKKMGITFHSTGTSICIDGPRYSTKAESIFFKDVIKADTIGMTLVPECVLARELEMCYVSLEMSTDYDAWSDEPVTATMVGEVMKDNLASIRNLLLEIIPNIPKERKKCECPTALEHAMH
jgi:5'-methylthioadenosine phosphorylase